MWHPFVLFCLDQLWRTQQSIMWLQPRQIKSNFCSARTPHVTPPLALLIILVLAKENSVCVQQLQPIKCHKFIKNSYKIMWYGLTWGLRRIILLKRAFIVGFCVVAVKKKGPTKRNVQHVQMKCKMVWL